MTAQLFLSRRSMLFIGSLEELYRLCAAYPPGTTLRDFLQWHWH